jgi:S-adenosylmethionine:tRNA ribosyltransferase-isomerase
LRVSGDVEAELERLGTMPIPPDMQRHGDEEDEGRYQTVFSDELGSAAAPTAILHLTTEMLENFRRKGATLGRVILHVGVGTFRPVTVDDLDAHPMHSESIEVGAELARQIAATRERGGKVVAIGTTVVRALESARDPENPGHVRQLSGATNLLIQPGYHFSVVDRMLTNFHQPRSTLLALVSAFAGLKRTRNAYEVALEHRYRFLSYGDAMWIPAPFGQDADSV